MISRGVSLCLKLRPMQKGISGSTSFATNHLPPPAQPPPHNFGDKTRQRLNDVLAVPEISSIIVEKKTRNLCQYYNTLIPDDKNEFLRILGVEYGVNQQNVLSLVSHLQTAQGRGPASLLRAEERIRLALTPKYQQLFKYISHLENGVKFLVDLRADILQMLSTPSTDQDSAYLQALNGNVRQLLSLWFSVGFLKLERITWTSPCDMLQKISDYEAVHPIRNWTDLKRRVGPYRRCFVFTHNSMPREPVIVLHIALASEISNSIQSIVDNNNRLATLSPSASPTHSSQVTEEPSNVTTAIFYSITSTQKGLQGVELGNYLIKNAVKELQTEFPGMSQFSSLSPIPGFREWLLTEISKYLRQRDIGEQADEIFAPDELVAICGSLPDPTDDTKPMIALKKCLANSSWVKNEALVVSLKEPLMRLCAKYLYLEKRRGYALNPVANFHLRNGAVMWRLNWMSDTSMRGLLASCGIMVNYRYFLDQTENNSKQYTEEKIIPASESVLEYVNQNHLKSSVSSEPSSP